MSSSQGIVKVQTRPLALQPIIKSGLYDTSKRVMDIVITLPLLALFLPVMLVIALLIKLDSHGPVISHHRRVGLRHTAGTTPLLQRVSTFQMYRFRTYHVQEQSLEHSIPRLAEDPRITRIGKLLQRLSLDELPTFLNVLKGDMSLVGPRPIPPVYLSNDYTEQYEQRFDVKPGISGLWQVSRWHIGTVEEMATMDISYIKNRSLWLDLQILVLTVRAVLQRSTNQHWVNKSVFTFRENVVYNAIKRLFDLILAGSALIVLSPLLLVITAAIRLDSPGPALFKQTRVGKRMIHIGQDGTYMHATHFTIYKFRTMHANQKTNDAIHQQWVQSWVSGKLGGQNPNEVVKPKRDPRVTRVGRLLRATSLDELPQFINVVKGDMSIVGPRPVPVYEVDAYNDRQYLRLDALPGITGLWQIKLRGRGTLDQMVDLDVEYIKKRTIWQDLKIMLLTVPAVIIGKGAK